MTFKSKLWLGYEYTNENRFNTNNLPIKLFKIRHAYKKILGFMTAYIVVIAIRWLYKNSIKMRDDMPSNLMLHAFGPTKEARIPQHIGGTSFSNFWFISLFLCLEWLWFWNEPNGIYCRLNFLNKNIIVMVCSHVKIAKIICCLVRNSCGKNTYYFF